MFVSSFRFSKISPGFLSIYSINKLCPFHLAFAYNCRWLDALWRIASGDSLSQNKLRITTAAIVGILLQQSTYLYSPGMRYSAVKCMLLSPNIRNEVFRGPFPSLSYFSPYYFVPFPHFVIAFTLMPWIPCFNY